MEVEYAYLITASWRVVTSCEVLDRKDTIMGVVTKESNDDHLKLIKKAIEDAKVQKNNPQGDFLVNCIYLAPNALN